MASDTDYTTKISIKVPEPKRFNGESSKLEVWLYSIKLYFGAVGWNFENEHSERCAAFTASLLEGPALQWHHRQSLTPLGSPRHFVDLEEALRQQFGILDVERRARDALKTIKQTNSVAEYVKRFEQVVMHLPTASVDELLHAFTYGLKGHVRSHVLLHNPRTLNEAQQQALTVDDRQQPNFPGFRPIQNTIQRNNFNNEIVPMEIGNMQKNKPKYNTKRYNNTKQYHNNNNGRRNNQEYQNKGRSLLYASGSINDKEVDLLIDSGASSNFISQQLVQAFGLDVKECTIAEPVCLPEGTKLKSQQYVLEPITLAGIQLPRVKFYILPMKPAIVLGLTFLQQRAVKVDFASLKLYFKYQNKQYEVLGHTEPKTLDQQTQSSISAINNLDTTLQAFQVGQKQIKKILKQKGVNAYLLQAHVVSDTIPTYCQYFHRDAQQLSCTVAQLYDESYFEQCAQAALHALQNGMVLEHLRCPFCKTDHLDEGKWASHTHQPHLCQVCGNKFRTLSNSVGNPLARYTPTLKEGKLYIQALQLNHLAQPNNVRLPAEFIQTASSIYKEHKQNIDQFVDNIFPASTPNEVQVRVNPIKNVLLINSTHGREPYKRMYQRTTFYTQGNTLVTHPQVLGVNKFEQQPISRLKAILTQKLTLFLDNVFYVANSQLANQLEALLHTLPNVVNNKIVVANTETRSKNYQPLIHNILKIGSPFLYILDHVQDTTNLPIGSLSHLLDVPTVVQQELRSILQEYSDVFPESLPLKPPPNRGLSDVHHIQLVEGAKPIAKAPYKTGPHEAQLIKKELDMLLEAKMITPSNLPWASPVLLVKKPDGSIRFCTDFRGLNSVTLKDKYPLPRTQELIDKLSKAKYFSSFDLCSGYWQVGIAPQDRSKTAFCTRYGQYEWQVMPFGLTNAPSTFQRIMNTLFNKLLDKCVVVYLDDILVYSTTLEEHKQHLRDVLQLLRKHQFFAKLKKCAFFQQQITFLGHDIDQNGMHINANKVKAVQQWPVPHNKQAVQRFVGFAQYFRQYIKSFSEVALPLTSLSKKDTSFEWNAECQYAFNTLKQKLCSAPVLHIFDPEGGPIELHTDASQTALSGIFYQVVQGRLKPVAYHSRKFNPAELNYSTTERELLAIVDSCRHWRHYLYGQSFIVRTDHRPLQYFFHQPNLSPRQLHWAEYLSDFQPGLRILYLAGSNNLPADALTRQEEVDIGLHPMSQFNNISALQSDLDSTQLQLLQEQDSSLTGVHKLAKSCDNRFCYKNNLLYTNDDQLVIPQQLVEQLIAEHHDHTGHFGVRRTVNRIKQRYWFQRMEWKIQQYIRNCDLCQRIKPRQGKVAGKLQPLPVPNKPWEHISMDFITDMPVNPYGGNMVFVVVDRFSKQMHLIPLSADTTAAAVAKAYLDSIVRLHGIPLTITCDRDTRFTARFWQELMRMLGTSINMSTAFHPQMDGQTEITIRSIEQLLRAYCQNNPDSWFDKLAQVELTINAFPHTSTGESPHKVVYGTHLNLPIDVAFSSSVPDATQVLQSLQECWQQVRTQLYKSQENMKVYFDKHRKEIELVPNSYVMVSTKNISLPAFKTKKLTPKFIGPFKIIKKVGLASYKLELPTNLRLHPVFHISILKPYTGIPPAQPMPIVVDGEPEYIVQAVIAHRQSRGQTQYLVRWQGYDASSDEWLTEKDLKNAQDVLLKYKRRQKLV